MATIPETPPETKLVSDKSVKIPTYAGGNITPQETFTTPYIGGESTINMVDTVSAAFNKVADQQTIIDQQARGYKQQQEAIDKGDPTYLAPGATFTTAGQAYQKGARIAYVSNEILGIDKQIQEFQNQSGYDVEKFLQKTRDYKKDWLGKFSSDLQSDMAFEFDKLSRNRALDIQTKKIGLDRAEQFQTMDNYDDYLINNFRAAYLSGGAEATGIIDPLQQLFSSKQKRIEAGQTADKILAQTDNIRQQILNVVTYKDYMDLYDPNSPKYNPAAAKSYIEDIRSGKRNPLGEIGDTFTEFFPNEGTITSKERASLVTILTHYETEKVKELAFNRSVIKQGNDAIVSNIKEGASYQVQEDGMIVYKPISLPQNDMLNARFTLAEINEEKLKVDQANIIGKHSFNAVISSLASQEKILADINAEKIVVQQNTALTDVQKNLHLGTLNEAEKKVQAIFDEKKSMVTKGEHAEYVIKKLKIPFDFTTDEGIEKFHKTTQTMFNLPFSEINLPKTQGLIDYTDINQQSTGDGILGRIAAGRATRPKYYEASVVTGVKNSTPKDLDFAVIGIMDISASGDAGSIAARELAQNYSNRKSLMEAHETKFGKSANGYKQDAERVFYQTYGKYVDLNTDHGKGIKDTFMLKYYSAAQNFAGSDPATKTQAIDYATAYINQYYPKVTFKNGTSTIVPLRLETSENRDLTINQITQRGNDLLDNPAKYGIILGKGETMDDWMQDQKRVRFVYDQGRLVLRTNNNMNVTRVMQRLPSSGNEIIATDMKISFGRQNGVTTDVEKTTQYDSDPAWYDGFAKTYTKTKTVVSTIATPETTIPPEAEYGPVAEFPSGQVQTKEKVFATPTTMTTIETRNAREYGREIVNYADKTLPKTKVGETNRLVYQDRFIRNLVPDTNRETTNAYNAISLALKDGKIDDNMLQYMAVSSGYLGQWLKYDYNRAVVIDTWQKNYQQITKTKTFNDAPTNMSVLQSFTAMMKDLEPKFKTAKFQSQFSTQSYDTERFTAE